MSNLQIIRPRLAFEREFGQHRNWWVRSNALSGNAVKVLLALLSHDQDYAINQTKIQAEIGLGQSAWRSAKEDLMRVGLLVEIRDRYPHGARRVDGTHCGGQRRFRLVLQDPPEGLRVELEDAIIESAEPIDLAEETPGQNHSRKSRVERSTTLDNQEWSVKPQVRAALENQEWSKKAVDNFHATLENQESLIGREEMGLDKDWINTSHPIPSPTVEPRDASAVAALDAQLKAIHPSLNLAVLERQVRGRINLREIDLAMACRDILDANKQPGGVRVPAAYIAKSLVADPDRWGKYEPYVGLDELIASLDTDTHARDCAKNDHDWGPETWPELQRAHCRQCGARRRDQDTAFAELEDEYERIGRDF